MAFLEDRSYLQGKIVNIMIKIVICCKTTTKTICLSDLSKMKTLNILKQNIPIIKDFHYYSQIILYILKKITWQQQMLKAAIFTVVSREYLHQKIKYVKHEILL